MKFLKSLFLSFDKYGFIYYPFLGVFGFGLLFYLTPFYFIPDFVDIKTYSKIYELFNLIISSLVSLIGVYISVSLVAYEFFKQKSGVDFQTSLLINRVNAYFISFSVLTILFTFLSSIVIHSSNPNNNEITIIYYNATLFTFVIALLFPVAFNLFSSLKPEKLAHDEVEKINNQTIFVALDDNIDKQAEIIEKDHLVKIESIIIALISVSDNIKAQSIIQKVSLKLSNLIIDEDNKKKQEYIINRLISFHIKIIDFSLLQSNSTVILKSIWSVIGRMYYVIVERKETVTHYEKFRKLFFERFFNRLFEHNKEEMIEEGIIIIGKIIQDQISFNMSDDNKISNLNVFRRRFESDFEEQTEFSEKEYIIDNHWSEISNEMMNCFSFVINKAIKSNKPELINKCFQQINELNFNFHLKNVGIYKQYYFYINSAGIISDCAYKAFEKNVFLEGHDAKGLTPSLLESLIIEKKPYARTVLRKYCYLLINLQQINKLDRWLLGGLTIGDLITIEGELGFIAKHCAINFNEGEEIRYCLEDCINTFRILKNYYEKNPPEDLGLYLVIKFQFENILD